MAFLSVFGWADFSYQVCTDTYLELERERLLCKVFCFVKVQMLITDNMSNGMKLSFIRPRNEVLRNEQCQKPPVWYEVVKIGRFSMTRNPFSHAIDALLNGPLTQSSMITHGYFAPLPFASFSPSSLT